ncbi:MAG: dihydropteroate synthase-like protein [Crenarchaeota archaeon]|nr:dihydropteroate synthase-like protein [Thermoproteota archaeon]
MKIAVITSRTAEPVIREVITNSKAVSSGKASVDVIAFPVAAIGVLTASSFIRISTKYISKLAEYDLILVPGTVRGDVSKLAELTGRVVYKASRDPGLLPRVIDYVVEGGVLDTKRPAEELMAVDLPDLKPQTIAFEVNGVKIPLRGPPLVLVAEIAPDIGNDLVVDVARRMEAEGAEIVIVGASRDTRNFMERVSSVVNEVDIPVIAEAPTPRMAKIAIDAGASGITISAMNADRYKSSIPEDSVIILGERDTQVLRRAVESYKKSGYEKIVADPVVGLPLIDYVQTVERYRSVMDLDVPIMFSAANAASVLDADTHGVYALLASMAVELSASLFLVVEDTYKTIHSVAEAREALRLAYRAWSRRIQPHGLGSRLLVVKQLEPPPKPTIPTEDARLVEGYVEPVMEKGYFRIEVDHDKRLIVVEYRLGREKRVYAGRSARSLARVITRELDISPEHAAYLGEELAKAELALRMGRTYIQDSDVVRMVWED